MSLSRLRTPAAGVVSGLLFALAFPPFGWVALLPLAPVPWLVALHGETGRGRALSSGFLFGLAFWCASIPWIVYVVTNFGGQSGWMGAVCLVIVAAILAPWPALVGWAIVAAAPAGSPLRLILFPLLWVASEHARASFVPAFPWNLAGFALYRHPIWLQAASVFGAYGVGLLVMAAAALLSGAVVSRKAAPAAGAALVVLAAGLFGVQRLARPARGGRAVRAALVQPGIPQKERLDPNAAARTYAAVIGQAREAAGEGADLIVLPESALPAYWDASPALRKDLTEIAAACRCPVLFNDIETEPGGRYFNVARIATAEGLAGQPYRKVHLVPFGEYVPFPQIFFFVRQVSTEIGEFAAALRPGLLEAAGLKIGTSVCYEVTYDSLARAETVLGANLLVTISNDSWYGKAGAQEQHFAGAVMRSVENGRWLLRAAITGVSGAADERGRIAARLAPDGKGTLFVTARLQTESTAWTRWGYRLPHLVDVAAALVLLFGLARWWRQRSS
jgi:apolipoprotein N-acyltransferase